MTIPRTILAMVIGFATPSFAEVKCGDAKAVLEELHSRYNESPRVSALMSGGEVLVLTVSPAGTWTGLGLSPDGQACILAAGDAFEVFEPEAQGVDG